MSKKFQLTIEEPCHEKWNNMAPADKGRFCDSCQKQVIDFTGMSDSQLVAFFKKPSTGSLCGRFNADQLNHDLEIPRKRIPWLKYFLTIALPAFFAVSKAKAQGGVSKLLVTGKTRTAVVPNKKTQFKPSPLITCDKIATSDTVIEPMPKNIIMGDTVGLVIVGELVEKIKSEEKVIEGRVINDKAEPIAFATIMVKGTKLGTQSDLNGNFKITLPENGNTLIASYIGYESVETKIDTNSKNIKITLEMELRTFTLGVIVPTNIPKKKIIPVIPRIFKDTAFKNFKFYPNPAIQSSVITLEWNKPEKGEFEIQFLNQQGQVMNRKYENFIEKRNSIQYTIPQVTPGSYFLVLANRKSGKKITEKIIIQ